MKNSDNKKALVTGAGTGVGRAIAITLTNHGYDVVLTGRREEKLREVEKEITKGQVFVIPADVTNEKSVQELRTKLLEQTGGKLDVLVNNVGGVTAMKPTGEFTLDEWNQLMNLNLTSQFLVTKAFLPDLRKSDSAKIISVTSQMSKYYMTGYSAYSASKAGVEALMNTVAEEEKENGIEVHLFDPGNVLSEGNPYGADKPLDVMDKIIDMI